MILTLDKIQLEDRRKFVKYGRDNFYYNPEKAFDPLKESQWNHKLFSLNLPDEISEIFLSKENFTLYLLDFFKFMRTKKIEVAYSKDVIRESLFKWLLAKTESEKESTFYSLLKMSKYNNFSFFDELLLVSFLIKELGKLKDYSIINNKFDYLDSLSERQENQILVFMLNLIKVSYQIELKDWENSLYTINNIESIKLDSPNALFYKSIIVLNVEDISQAENSIEKLIEYDNARLKYAIGMNSLKMYELFLFNTFTQNLFTLSEGPLLLEKLTTLNSSVQANLELLPKIINKLKTLTKDSFKEFKNDNALRKLEFFNLLMSRFGSSKSYFFINSIEQINSKLNELIYEFMQNVNAKFDKLVEDFLVRFDEKASANKELLKNLEESNNDILRKEEEKNQKVLNDFENRINNEIKHYETMLESFEHDSTHSSFNSLKSSFIYNSLFSLFVLLSGGFAEYSNSYLTDIANLGSILSIVLVGGFKWGAITFIIGFVISIFVFINNIHSRYAAKNNLLQKISNLNLEKEKGRQALRTKFEQKKKTQVEKFEKSKQQLLDEIESLRKSKEEEKQKLIEKFQDDKNSFLNPLNEILEM